MRTSRRLRPMPQRQEKQRGALIRVREARSSEEREGVWARRHRHTLHDRLFGHVVWAAAHRALPHEPLRARRPLPLLRRSSCISLASPPYAHAHVVTRACHDAGTGAMEGFCKAAAWVRKACRRMQAPHRCAGSAGAGLGAWAQRVLGARCAQASALRHVSEGTAEAGQVALGALSKAPHRTPWRRG